MSASVQDVSIKFVIPSPSIPRPGERVFFFSERVPHRGILIGYNVDCKAIVRTDFNNELVIDLDQIRLDDPRTRKGANFLPLVSENLVINAGANEILLFNDLLGQRIPPGPSCMELVLEIWNRGYEVYIVGGTVRDTINGIKSKDIDIVTTMPLTLCKPIIQSMFGYNPFISQEYGYLKIGPKKGKAFVDIKNFTQLSPGCNDVRFGNDFLKDLPYRDFACNAIYYEPINHLFIDPSRCGIHDARGKRLSIVNDITLPNQYHHHAKIFFRFFKFVNRGYTYTNETLQQLSEEFVPKLASMTHVHRIAFLNSQIGLGSTLTRRNAIDQFQKELINVGFEGVWKKYFEPYIAAK